MNHMDEDPPPCDTFSPQFSATVKTSRKTDDENRKWMTLRFSNVEG